MSGFAALFYKELLRFWKVAVQTVVAPVVMALLYLLIFSHALESRIEVYPGVSYTSFLVPGLVMMSMLQNAFSNSSSSLIQSKMQGNIVFVLLPPLSYLEFFLAYLGAAILRGLIVGLGVWAVTLWYAPFQLPHPGWLLAFALLACAIMGAIGIMAGIWAEKYDQLAAFQNFLIMPLTFLSGVFYSIHTLPPFWQAVSRANPALYLIDGFRYAFVGQSDTDPWLGLLVAGACFVAISALTLMLLKSGYKLRH
ncbi:MAG: metal-dependent hydrolase [Thiobacillus sp. 63-78]|uniref:ABC transporter permease n=1 Tax=Thiobacillus sp. 63-78 TaxID=1895859 RepID=UPI00086B7EF2|nr:ABC transporter permease [Thiobacillus sp. 63-78]MBN8762540.1 ABC transporter permease [Thiobacillus sp.]ODV12942.1 MAG: metal-dependent hydrolase [Thiobacillus sp. SCN 64-317]MBN8766974.1 ABC transporter permease [Thiobacillus sp.]MBN8774941.1 ABC transporter permease [Thiobacillus sp.]OJZ08160.1 MAG: metal-dependent hydrolase [Thiobacillus sp. 63-78]